MYTNTCIYTCWSLAAEALSLFYEVWTVEFQLQRGGLEVPQNDSTLGGIKKDCVLLCTG